MSRFSSYTYETAYIIRSGVSESDSNAIFSKIESVIGRFSGKVITKDDWGLKELAYPIDKQTMGHYRIVVYTGQSGVVDEIERHFRISPDVIRFITIQVPSDYDYAKTKKNFVPVDEERKGGKDFHRKPRGGYGGSHGHGDSRGSYGSHGSGGPSHMN